MTILRILVWFAVVAVLMGAAVWLAERPGTITAEWHGWRLDTSVGVILIVVALLMLAGVALWHAWRWIVGAPGALIEGWGESRRRQGYRALTHGLAAVAAGDANEAQKQAKKAEKLLSEPPLTLLLSAQAAQLAGDREGAKRAFSTMLEDEQTAFLGLRGLIAQALRDGDPQQALALAERAFRLRPDTEWVVHSLFDMQAQIGQWRAAQETLDTGIRRKVVHAGRGRALKALILVERSRAAERDGNLPDALTYAREAFSLAPERIAAAECYADLLIKADDPRRAIRSIERAWSLAPHPDLAALYLKASAERDALKRIAVVRRLVAQKPDDLESHLALAQASLDAALWGEARRHLQTAGGTIPATRVCRMMAEVEERAHSDEAKVREWLARAAAAPADRAWRCTACGAQHESWRPVCESCGAFGTLQWRAPGTFGQLLPPGPGQPTQTTTSTALPGSVTANPGG